MESNMFMDKAIQPDEDRLLQALGETGKYWLAIKKHIRETHGEVSEEWKFYSPKYGWILKTLLKKRNLFFFSAFAGYFRMVFVFGDRAVAAVEQSDLPDALIAELKNARKYAEGRGIQIEVKSPQDVEMVKKLIDIKVRN